jgi:hypothetical protein
MTDLAMAVGDVTLRHSPLYFGRFLTNFGTVFASMVMHLQFQRQHSMRDLIPGDVVAVANKALDGLHGVLVRIEDDDKAVIRLDDPEGIHLVVPARLVYHADGFGDGEDH